MSILPFSFGASTAPVFSLSFVEIKPVLDRYIVEMFLLSVSSIDSIQIEPRSRQIIVGTIEGDKFTCFKDDVFDFEVLPANHKPSIKTNKKRNKGKKR